MYTSRYIDQINVYLAQCLRMMDITEVNAGGTVVGKMANVPKVWNEMNVVEENIVHDIVALP